MEQPNSDRSLWSAREWSSAVSARLQQRWPRVDPVQLDDLALDLWSQQALRTLSPEQAADEWLRPVRGE